MKRIAILATALLVALPLRGQIGFAYDAVASTVFDNREYDASELNDSQTLFGIRLSADVGVSFTKGRTVHKLMAGIAPLYEFGSGFKFKPLLYYHLDTPLGSSRFTINAGLFPRRESRAYYSTAFFSLEDRFYRDVYQGIQFGWKGHGFYYELGVDWKGMLTGRHPARREEFVVYSGGAHSFSRLFEVGYSAYMHHYANNFARTADNVVDDFLLSPYASLDLGPLVGMQRLKARVAYLQGIQRDRAVSSELLAPAKGELMLEARMWNIGICNDLYYGGDLMPLYDMDAPEGGKYGTNLYMGERFMRNAGGRKAAAYDLVSVYWEPRIAEKLLMRVQVNFHFNGGYAGNQELIYLIFTL